MLKIRLSRTGKTRQPSFRVLLQEHTSPVKGKFIEEMGYYKPASKSKEFKVDLERIKYWLKFGAQVSDTLAVLLKKEGVENMDQFIAPRNKQHKKKGEAGKETATPATATPAAAAAPAGNPSSTTPSSTPAAATSAPKT